jgi:hypothetical protein
MRSVWLIANEPKLAQNRPDISSAEVGECPEFRGNPTMVYHSSEPASAPQIVRLEDRQSGLDGVIVIHSTALGPAAGG